MTFIAGFYEYLKELEGKNENLKDYSMNSKEIYNLQVLARLSEHENEVSEEEAIREIKRKRRFQQKKVLKMIGVKIY